MVTDPNEWFAVMCEAKYRNELPVWKETKHLSGDELDLRDEDLEMTHSCAVVTANIAARNAYIAAFNEAYDEEHRKIFAALDRLHLDAKCKLAD